jgi:uncharacterized membrane protein
MDTLIEADHRDKCYGATVSGSNSAFAAIGGAINGQGSARQIGDDGLVHLGAFDSGWKCRA